MVVWSSIWTPSLEYDAPNTGIPLHCRGALYPRVGVCFVYTGAMIFKRVGEGRPYPDHGLTSLGTGQRLHHARSGSMNWSQQNARWTLIPCSPRIPPSTGICLLMSCSGKAPYTSKMDSTGLCELRFNSAQFFTRVWWSCKVTVQCCGFAPKALSFSVRLLVLHSLRRTQVCS